MSSLFSSERMELVLNAVKGKKLAKVFSDAMGQSSNLDIQRHFSRYCVYPQQ